MTINIKDLIVLGATYEAVGTAVDAGMQRVFKSVGAHNTSGVTVTLQVWLVPNGGFPDATTLIVNRPLPNNKSDLLPELVGRGLNAGGVLYMAGLNIKAGFTAIDTPA